MNWIILSIITLTLAFHSEAFSAEFLEMREFRGNVCYDGDTCYVLAPSLPEPLQKMSVRILGIDTPEIRGDCDEEKALAKQGRVVANREFREAETIEFRDLKWDKYGGRILSNVYLDGELYSQKLIDVGLARSYDGGTKEAWCD